jgi:hypothetical protein
MWHAFYLLKQGNRVFLLLLQNVSQNPANYGGIPNVSCLSRHSKMFFKDINWSAGSNMISRTVLGFNSSIKLKSLVVIFSQLEIPCRKFRALGWRPERHSDSDRAQAHQRTRLCTSVHFENIWKKVMGMVHKVHKSAHSASMVTGVGFMCFEVFIQYTE